MNRRTFTKLTLAGTLAASHGVASAADGEKGKPFKSKFGPHENLLPTAPKGIVDQMKFAYDLGFRGWEENWLMRKPEKLWEEVAAFLQSKKDFTMGISVISGGAQQDFSNPTKEGKERLKKDMEKGVKFCKITGQTGMTFLPGVRNDLPREEQIKKSVDTMNFLCDIVEEHGIILMMEPLSHPLGKKEPLLRSFADGAMLSKLVNRKSCRLLADYFHEGQIGNGPKLIENTNAVWDEVGYVQYGASPGRKEPGTGKLDYTAVTKLLREKGYTGVIGMEHGASKKGKEGLDALLAAYRKIDC
ncbi:MAG: TIM barrel protein [Akkermansiaceae bacterium]